MHRHSVALVLLFRLLLVSHSPVGMEDLEATHLEDTLLVRGNSSINTMDHRYASQCECSCEL